MQAAMETIRSGDQLLAIVIRANFRRDGIEFFTPPEFSQQLAYMRRPAGHVVRRHVHNVIRREVAHTQEVLFVRSGRIEVQLFDDQRREVATRELIAGDVIMLAAGGHGIRMLEESELIEVKQGPHAGEEDKSHF